MSDSSATICYGIQFPSGFVFPWDDDKWNGEFDEWYYKGVLGYKPPFAMYKDDGGYIGDTPTEETITAYYKPWFEFKKANPAPVVVETYDDYDYDDDCSCVILAIPGTSIFAHHTEPQEFTVEQLCFISGDLVGLIEFCEEHDIVYDDVNNPRWWLSCRVE